MTSTTDTSERKDKDAGNDEQKYNSKTNYHNEDQKQRETVHHRSSQTNGKRPVQKQTDYS